MNVALLFTHAHRLRSPSRRRPSLACAPPLTPRLGAPNSKGFSPVLELSTFNARLSTPPFPFNSFIFIRLRTLCHSCKSQPLFNQQDTNSLHHTPGVVGYLPFSPLATRHSPLATRYMRALIVLRNSSIKTSGKVSQSEY